MSSVVYLLVSDDRSPYEAGACEPERALSDRVQATTIAARANALVGMYFLEEKRCLESALSRLNCALGELDLKEREGRVRSGLHYDVKEMKVD